MSLDNTTEELIQRVRDIVDEDNISDISDPLVMRMLNRAQQELVRILTRRYKNHFMREIVYNSSDLKLDSGSQARIIDLTGQAFAYSVNAVDARIGTAWLPVQQVPFTYTSFLDNTTSGSIPLQYAMQGNSIYLYPGPQAGTEIRVRYQFRAPKIVKSQGRITSFDLDAETLTLDALGSGLSTSVTDLGAFVNIIDHLTGEIKATMQVSGITTATKTLQLKTASLDRTSVFGYAVSTDLPTTVALDDLVCLADGTCVPLLAHDVTNFLVDIAGFYVKRKLGIVESADFQDREDIMKAIKGMRFGRQNVKKIQRTSAQNAFSWQPFFLGK